jgi:hypothetical protein
MLSSHTPPIGDSPRPKCRFHVGDLVVPTSGYPQLCEVMMVEAESLIRIRGLEWSPGYTVLVRFEAYRPVTGRLSH